MNLKKYIKIILLLVVQLFSACENPNDHSTIPDYPVSLDVTVDLEAIELRSIGGGKAFITPKLYQSLGYGGILIFHGFDEQYYAFDLACPHEAKRQIRVALHGIGGQVKCSECGSVFNVGYGSGVCAEGISKEGLKRYRVYESYTPAGLVLRVRQ